MPSKMAAGRPSTASSHDGTFGTISGSTVPCSLISGNRVGSRSPSRMIELGLSWYVISPLITARGLFFFTSISQKKVNPNSASPWKTLTGPPSNGSPIKPPPSALQAPQHQYRGQGHHRAAPTRRAKPRRGDSLTSDFVMSIPRFSARRRHGAS